MSEVSTSCMALNALVNDYSYTDSYRIFMALACRIGRDTGHKYLNVQGSEDLGQFRSKMRLKPFATVPRTHLVFDQSACDEPLKGGMNPDPNDRLLGQPDVEV